MPDAPDQRLLEALLDSWGRNNSISLSLLRALPEDGLEATAMEGSPSVAELFTHIHFVRLVFVPLDDARELARDPPERKWVAERDPGQPVAPSRRRSLPTRSCRPREPRARLEATTAGASARIRELGVQSSWREAW